MRVLYLLILCCTGLPAYSQAWVWEKPVVTSNNSIATDPNNNIIVLGANGTATQLSKYTKDGLLLWSNRLTKSTAFTPSGSVVADKNGNIYIFTEGFDSVNHVFTGVKTRGITRFDPQGNVEWHTLFYTTTQVPTKFPLQIDENDNLYAAYAETAGTAQVVHLGASTTSFLTSQNYYFAMGSLTPAGTPRWVRYFRFALNASPNPAFVSATAFSLAGNRLYFAGNFAKCDLYLDNGVTLSNNRCTAWLAAFNCSTGQSTWGKLHSLFYFCSGLYCGCSIPSISANAAAGTVALTNNLNGAFVFKPLDTIASISASGQTAVKSYYTIYDSLGNPVKGKILETVPSVEGGVSTPIAGSRGNFFFVRFNDTLRKVDTGFNVIWKVTLPPAMGTIFIPKNTNDILATYTRAGVLYLAKMVDSAGVISGCTYADWDNNGIYTSADSALPNILITTNAAPNASSGSDSGRYYLYAAPGTYAVSAQFDHPYYEFLPATQTATVAQLSDNVTGKDFRLRPTFAFTDVSVNFSALNVARPGREAYYTVTVKNFGAASTPVEVGLKLPALTTYSSITGASVTVNAADSITISMGSVQPFETKRATLYLTIATTATLHDTLRYYPRAYPFTNDTIKKNNADTLLQEVRTSFDPNDKLVDHAAQPIAAMNQALTYTVRFQNTGNDTAFYVRIADTLSAKLDIKTFNFIDASHPVTTEINKNIISFIFNPILLPDSNHNEPLSHGFVKFKINPAQPASVNDTIYNAAAIYFDYNTPVATNTVKSWFNPLPVLPVILKSFVAEKKAASVLLKFVTASEADFTHFVIERSLDGTNFSPVGTVAATGTPSSGATYFFEDKSPARGTNFYRLKMVDRNTRTAYSWILVVNFREDARPAITVFPSPAHDNLYISFRELNGPQTFTCIIADAGGKVVWTASINTGTRDTWNVNTSRLANGIYFIKVTGKDMNYQRKFNVQH